MYTLVTSVGTSGFVLGIFCVCGSPGQAKRFCRLQGGQDLVHLCDRCAYGGYRAHSKALVVFNHLFRIHARMYDLCAFAMLDSYRIYAA